MPFLYTRLIHILLKIKAKFSPPYVGCLSCNHMLHAMEVFDFHLLVQQAHSQWP